MTIKANELRIGNWVHGSSGKKLIKIDYIKFDRIGMRLIGEGYAWLISESYEETIAFCKPIPLTEEILSKSKEFIYNKENGEYVYGEIDCLSIHFMYFRMSSKQENKDVMIRVKYIQNDPTENTSSEVILCFIQHLHQLQNIVHFLFNRELEINL